MITKELAAFFEEGLDIHFGTRNGRLEPNGLRAVAVKVDADGTHVNVYVPQVAAPRVLPDLEDNGRAAVVLVRPTDDRGCQIKGVFAGSRVADEDEHRVVERQWNQRLQYLDAIGLPPVAMHSWITWPCLVLRVRVTALFDQTPGPGAGAALK